MQADGHAPLTRGQRLYLLLHYRFGHASLKRLRAMGVYHSILKKKHRVECPVCMAAKAAKKPHVGKLLRMAYVLGLVHFDIQGPFAFPDIDKNLSSAGAVALDGRKWKAGCMVVLICRRMRRKFMLQRVKLQLVEGRHNLHVRQSAE